MYTNKTPSAVWGWPDQMVWGQTDCLRRATGEGGEAIGWWNDDEYVGGRWSPMKMFGMGKHEQTRAGGFFGEISVWKRTLLRKVVSRSPFDGFWAMKSHKSMETSKLQRRSDGQPPRNGSGFFQCLVRFQRSKGFLETPEGSKVRCSDMMVLPFTNHPWRLSEQLKLRCPRWEALKEGFQRSVGFFGPGDVVWFVCWFGLFGQIYISYLKASKNVCLTPKDAFFDLFRKANDPNQIWCTL